MNLVKNAYPEMRLNDLSLGFPFMDIVPDTIPVFFLPAKISMKVVFPAPEGPTMAIT